MRVEGGGREKGGKQQCTVRWTRGRGRRERRRSRERWRRGRGDLFSCSASSSCCCSSFCFFFASSPRFDVCFCSSCARTARVSARFLFHAGDGDSRGRNEGLASSPAHASPTSTGGIEGLARFSYLELLFSRRHALHALHLLVPDLPQPGCHSRSRSHAHRTRGKAPCTQLPCRAFCTESVPGSAPLCSRQGPS